MTGAGEQLSAEPTRVSGSLIDEPATRPALRARDSVAVSENVHAGRAGASRATDSRACQRMCHVKDCVTRDRATDSRV